jgi:hypothetical protein
MTVPSFLPAYIRVFPRFSLSQHTLQLNRTGNKASHGPGVRYKPQQ